MYKVFLERQKNAKQAKTKVEFLIQEFKKFPNTGITNFGKVVQ